jgi:hypothetical protein
MSLCHCVIRAKVIVAVVVTVESWAWEITNNKLQIPKSNILVIGICVLFDICVLGIVILQGLFTAILFYCIS